jgi:hypothetical protein
MFRPRIERDPLGVRSLKLPKDQEDWAEGWIRRELGPNPSVDKLEKSMSSVRLSDDERRILEAIRDSKRGLRMQPAVTITKDGLAERPAKTWTLTGARVAAKPRSGLDPSASGAAFDAQLLPSLLGQEATLPAFQQLQESFQSSTRQIPPLMVISGPKGHGKDEAVAGYAHAALSPNATTVAIDFADKTDADLEELFSEGLTGGELSLAKLIDAEDHRSAVIHLRGLAPQKSVDQQGKPVWVQFHERAPKLAQRLLSLLAAKKDGAEPGHVWVNFVADFDVDHDDKDAEKDPVKLLAAALGPMARHLPSAKTRFGLLDEKAMQAYGDEQLRLLLSKPGFSGLQLEIELAAREAIAQILATPHQPLVELEARLSGLLIERIGSRADLFAADGVIRVGLSDFYAQNPAALKERIAGLKEKDADLLSLGNILRVREEGRVGDDEARATVLEQGAELGTKALELVNRLSAAEESFAPEYRCLSDFLTSADAIARQLEAPDAPPTRGKSAASVLSPDELRADALRSEDLLLRLAANGEKRLSSLGLTLPAPPARAARDVLDAVGYLAAGLKAASAGATQAQRDKLDANRRGLGQLLREAVAKVREANADALGGTLLDRFQELGGAIQALVEVAGTRAADDVWPLVTEDEARDVLDRVEQLRTLLDEAPKKPGPAATLVAAMRAAKAVDVFPDILSRAERVATALAGLAKEDRPTIADVQRAERSDTPSLRRKLAKELVRCENGATEEDARIVQAELVKLPLRVLKRIKRNGTPVTVIRGKITEYLKLPEEKKKERPPGFPEGTTYEDVPAIFTNLHRDGKDTSEVIIVTAERGGRRVIPGLSPNDGKNSVIHEMMHAFDRNGVYSQTDRFQDARKKNASDLSPYEKQGPEKLGEQTFDRGAAETFAITGERLYGRDAQVKAKRPDLVEFVESATKDLDPEEGDDA